MPQTYYCPQWYGNTATTTNYYPQNQHPHYLTTTGSPNATWQQWVNTSSIATTPLTDQIWTNWMVAQNDYRYQPIVQTPEQIRAGQERYETERRERRVAHARARVLLGEFLNEEQKAELEHHGRFHVTGSRGRRYCIRTSGQSGNVDLLKPDGSVQARLCCHPRGYLPEGDAWLMQMIEIRHDEQHFLRTANVHRGRLPADVLSGV